MGVAIPRPCSAVNDSASGAQVIDGSLKFDDSKNQSLKRTPSSDSSGTKATLSFWFKPSALHNSSNGGTLFSRDSWHYIQFYSETLYIGNTSYWIHTDAVFRDFSAWYHVTIVLDTTQNTATDRQKIYVNGVQQVRGSTFGTDPAEDASYEFLNGTEDYMIGEERAMIGITWVIWQKSILLMDKH